MPKTRYFSRELFRFLEDLATHNDRPWFQKNKDRYERHFKDASLRFIEDFAPRLRSISEHFVADPSPVGGSLFRIYRDTRFSKDKSPYKTHVGIRFLHERAKDVHAPTYYLHIDPAGVFAGCGIWHPGGEALKAIREAIVEDPAAWKRAKNAKRFQATWTLAGDSLKRAPRGFDPEHPLVDDLRRKDFIGTSKITKKVLLGPDFMDQFTRMCRDGASLQRFLCSALGLAY